MKKVSIIAIALLFCVTTVFAADFAPVPMKLSAPATIGYEFDGSDLAVQVDVTGVGGVMNFLVFTKGKAEEIGQITNGFLGWHYVNKIDTCIFISEEVDILVGSNTYVWDGKDADGGVVPEGEYTYYIYANDNKNIKTLCTSVFPFNWNENAIIRMIDDDGSVMTNPEIYTGGTDVKGGEDRTEKTHRKWVIGSDPDDATLIETTTVMAYADKVSIALDPLDHTMWFKATQTPAAGMEIAKYQWVPNGASEIQTDWGEDGLTGFSFPSYCDELHNSLAVIGETLYTINQNFFDDASPSELVYIDLEEGFEITRVDLSKWWVNIDEGGEAGGQAVGGPHDLTVGPNETLSIGAHTTCVNHMLAPYREEDAGGDVEDITLWVNLNGDYTGDHNFEETSEKPWICNDFNVGPYKYNTGVDALGFTTFPSYDMGAVTYGIFAPDGTGMSYKALAGETATIKYGNYFIQTGCPYDGLYMDDAPRGDFEGAPGWWYVGHDSITGTIGTGIGVADDAPAAFAVAQNSPNPFNPTTTIGFTLANSGTVSVDVYNVAGQNVDTIVNEFMDSGSHSVVWDASDFSAGVYFYTVKSGDFSKTIKMTLVK